MVNMALLDKSHIHGIHRIIRWHYLPETAATHCRSMRLVNPVRWNEAKEQLLMRNRNEGKIGRMEHFLRRGHPNLRIPWSEIDRMNYRERFQEKYV